MTKKGNKIQKKILKIITRVNKPFSTRELTLKIKVSWHTVQQYCLELLAEGKIQRMRVAGAHAWMKKQTQNTDIVPEINTILVKTIDEEIELLRKQLDEAMKKKTLNKEIEQI